MDIRHRLAKLLFLPLCILWISDGPVRASERGKLKSNVHILFDLSTSYFNPDFKKRNTNNLKKTFDLITTLSKRIMKPAIIQAIPIQEFSGYSNELLCDIKICKKSLFKKKSNCPTIKVLKKQVFPSCIKKIMKSPPGQATDIIGAIEKSVRLSRTQAPDGDQTMIILSDFLEWRGKEIPIPKVNLEDFHILLIYRAQLQHEITKNLMLPGEEARKYAEKLKTYGAENVVIADEQANFSNLVERLH